MPNDGQERVFADVGDHHGVDFAPALEDAETGICWLRRARVCPCERRQNSFHPPRQALRAAGYPPIAEQAAVLRLTRAKSAALRAVTPPTKTPSIEPASFHKTTTTYPHAPIPDPLGIWGSPFSFTVGSRQSG